MSDFDDMVERVNRLIADAAKQLPWDHPIKAVRWVHIDRVMANNWNPNAVARNEMRLLHTSIANDGYTQPCVTIYDPALDKYVIVDGFHRYTIMRTQPDIAETTGGYLPVVVLDKPVADQMASTVRHNRARGKHSVGGMSNLVFQMLREGKTDAEICNSLGLEPQELLRLKHITGFSKLMADHEYTLAWETAGQVAIKGEFAERNPDEAMV